MNVKNNFRPDIYHCFDISSYNIIRLFISSETKRLIVTKCGGPNPKKYPHITNIVLFSLEDLEWFKKNNKYKNTYISFIPNRINLDSLGLESHPIDICDDYFIFLRICRFNSVYEKSINDSFRLIEYLYSHNINNVRLYVIGVIENYELFELLNNHELVKKGLVSLLTDREYTSEASKMLYLASAVIGTGRGLMEAASLSIPVLAINAKGNIPVLLDETNFEDAFITNFSTRNVFRTYDEDLNLGNIIRLITDHNYYDQMSQYSKNIFEDYFDIDKAEEKYNQLYHNARYGKRRILCDLLFIIKSQIGFYRNYLVRTKK